MEMEVETPKGKSKDWSRQKGRKTDKPKDQLPAKCKRSMEMEVETPKGKSKSWSRQMGRKTD